MELKNRIERMQNVSQSCPTLCDPTDCSPLGSSVRGILQARILEQVSPSPGYLTNLGIDPHLFHCRTILYRLSHQGSLKNTYIFIYTHTHIQQGYLSDSIVKNPPAKEMLFNSWVRKIRWRRNWQPTPVFVPGISHGQRSLLGQSPWGHRRVRHNLEINNIQQGKTVSFLPIQQGPLSS